MNKFSNILHPITFAKLSYRLLASQLKDAIVKWHLRHIKRGYVERCWCGGKLLPFKWSKNYGQCENCGCYVNKHPPLDLIEMYSQDLYWHVMQKYYGYPTLEARAKLYKKDGRLDFWLNLVKEYAPKKGTVIEIGCAPGILLSKLQSAGYICIGLEPDLNTSEWIKKKMNIEMRSGIFPDVNLPNCDLCLAFDVMEHSSDPGKFMIGISNLLNPEGIAIIQTPIERYGYSPPFGDAYKNAFKEFEHLFLFTDDAMQKLANISGLEILLNNEKLWIHHEICIFQKNAK